MALSNNIISQFVKITNDTQKKKSESTIYGVVTSAEYNSDNTLKAAYVLVDGATDTDNPLPVSSSVDVRQGDKVIVVIKNHTAIITGNLTSQSANIILDTENNTETQTPVKDVIGKVNDTANSTNAKVEELTTTVTDLGYAVADKVSANELFGENGRIVNLESDVADFKEATADNFEAVDAKIENLDNVYLKTANAEITYAKIEKLEAVEESVESLEADNVTINQRLEASEGKVETLETNNVTVNGKISAAEADISNLKNNKLDSTSAAITYATINFSNINEAAIRKIFSETGLIKDLVVGTGTITGELVGVTIKGDLIEGNTVKADKLVVKGSDGLYYKLNFEAGTFESGEVVPTDSLHGSVITAQSITAEKVKVTDLVAFGATIGGFVIDSNAIHSVAKTSVDNTTPGIYFDNDGQIAFGDQNNFVKCYKDSNDEYHVEISSSSVLMSSSNKNVETAIAEVAETVENIQIGGRNILRNSSFRSNFDEWTTTTGCEITDDEGISCGKITGALTSTQYCGQSILEKLEPNQSYTISAWVKATNIVAGTTNYTLLLYHDGYYYNDNDERKWFGYGPVNIPLTDEWSYITKTITTDNKLTTATSYMFYVYARDLTGELYFRDLKIEKGNKPTDWTPAQEDMATADSVDDAKNTADAANTKADEAKALIQQLSDSIAMLVTDGSGTSLMTQTADGWTFSTASLQESINSTSEGLSDLQNDLGSTSSAVNVLKQAVDDLGILSEYIKITTYEDEPCIELGDTDSDFKLLITNTRILFKEGSSTPAYITNQSLHIEKAVVEEELQQGDFVWKVRSNGNLGLTWKGGNN